MIAPAPAPMAFDSSPSSLAIAARSRFARLAAGLLLSRRAALQGSWNCRARSRCRMVAGSLALAALAARNSSSAAL